MSRLIGPMFDGSPLLLLPLLALALFVLVFSAVVVRLALRGAKAFDPASRMPLDDERLPPRKEPS